MIRPKTEVRQSERCNVVGKRRSRRSKLESYSKGKKKYKKEVKGI